LNANYVVENLSLLQTTTQRYVTIWTICVKHGSVLTLVRWVGKWVHLT